MTENKRIIKFRGKRIDNGEWVFGDGVVYVGDDYSAIPQTQNVTSKDYQITLCKVILETTGQFTGLLDKNGKEIYEGDIIRGKNGKLWVIEWDGYRWCLNNRLIADPKAKFAGLEKYSFSDWLKCHPHHENCEIELIGSVYQNPELISNGE